MATADARTIQIPVRGSQEIVEISTAELPAECTDIIDLLKAEFAPLALWLTLAV